MGLGLLLDLIGITILIGQNHFVLNSQSIIAVLSASLYYAIASS